MAALGDRRFRDFTELRDSLPKGKILVPMKRTIYITKNITRCSETCI